MTDSTAISTETHHQYGIHRTVNLDYDDALARTRQALQQEGFGVLFEIDMQAKMKEKLGQDMQRYIILGACHPPMAWQTLQSEIDIGLLLPCNVIVYEKGGHSVVAAIDAAKMMTVVGNPDLEANAQQINEMLRRVVEAV
ncbi:MAG TPA: DUF302 domain-containing protein [Blastocatellia bacterium]|nr:DUF302 domain-containing protein [Blastocatellia bacterium]